MPQLSANSSFCELHQDVGKPGDPERRPIDLLKPYDADPMAAWKIDPAHWECQE
jgi:hypothetical protein